MPCTLSSAAVPVASRAALRRPAATLTQRSIAAPRGLRAGLAARPALAVRAAAAHDGEQQQAGPSSVGGKLQQLAAAPVAVPAAEEQGWWGQMLAKVAQVALVASLAVCALVAVPGAAEAAKSGGRVGGSNFSRGATTSRSTSMTTHTHSTVVVHSSPFGFGGFGLGSFFMPTYGFGYGGYGMGYGFGLGRSMLSLLFLGLAAYVVVNVVQSFMDGGEDVAGDGFGTCSVVKLQVGLLGLARGLQKDLDNIAARADTSDPEGLQYVLQETVLSLVRNPDYCVFGFSETDKTRGLDSTEAKFNEKSLSERGKFKAETLVNVGGRAKTGTSGASSEMSNELIVVTILAAVEGKMELPPVNSLQELKDALNKLGGVSADGLLAVEVMWTPQEEGDSFTRDELVTDYPLLNPL